jgi:hypothetical protein
MTPSFGASDAVVAADQVQKWLKDCTDNHKSGVCGATSTPQSLPTRVLEIQGPQQVRLYTTSPEERACYVCLSHCWGGNVELQTTSKTKAGFEKQIKWEDVPLTFRHAIDMTWRLGLKYIWIDSLCIIQDNISDWRREGSNMASIYSLAHLTLAATNSTNCNGGFYTPNTSVHPIPGFLPPVYVREATDHRTFFENKLPLMSRAWVFQERMLSPRTVQFTAQELVWECTTTELCECKACGEDEWNRQNKSQYDWLPMFEVLAPQQRSHGMRDQWYDIVDQYTNLNLTFRKDIFPALQGVTKRMQAARKCRCVAGLWENSFAEDLLWSCAATSESRATTYWAPTWSWASHQGAVSWPPSPINLVKIHIEVLSASVTPVGDDPTGEISAGELILRGQLKQASVDNSRPMWPYVIPLRNGKPDTKFVDAGTPLRPSVLKKTHHGEKNFWHKCDMDVQLESPFEVSMLWLGEDNVRSYCLMLRRVEWDGDMVTFERVGVAWYGGKWLDWFDGAEGEVLRIV